VLTAPPEPCHRCGGVDVLPWSACRTCSDRVERVAVAATFASAAFALVARISDRCLRLGCPGDCRAARMAAAAAREALALMPTAQTSPSLEVAA
jgi:hypothetical protein